MWVSYFGVLPDLFCQILILECLINRWRVSDFCENPHLVTPKFHSSGSKEIHTWRRSMQFWRYQTWITHKIPHLINSAATFGILKIFFGKITSGGSSKGWSSAVGTRIRSRKFQHQSDTVVLNLLHKIRHQKYRLNYDNKFDKNPTEDDQPWWPIST